LLLKQLQLGVKRQKAGKRRGDHAPRNAGGRIHGQDAGGLLAVIVQQTIKLLDVG